MTEIEEVGGGPVIYPIDELSDSIWWREMLTEFGLQRSVMVIGWSALYGASMRDGEKLEEVRDRLLRMGLPRTTTYRALQDIRRLMRRLEVVYEREKRGIAPSDAQIIRRLPSLNIPIMG